MDLRIIDYKNLRLLKIRPFTKFLYYKNLEPYVTGFRKTDHIVTIDIARNTDLKY